jgi:hypothetical protein
MDSNHNSEPEADPDENYDSENSESSESSDNSEPSFVPMRSFFERARHASSKKLHMPPSSAPLLNYRELPEICEPCRRLLKLISNVVATGHRFDAKYYETYAEVKSSAENGCGICAMHLREFRMELTDKYKPGKKIKTGWLHASGSSFSWEVVIPWMDGDPTPGVTQLEHCTPGDKWCFTARIESFLAGSQSMMLHPL